jgi:hypothetical protein
MKFWHSKQTGFLSGIVNKNSCSQVGLNMRFFFVVFLFLLLVLNTCYDFRRFFYLSLVVFVIILKILNGKLTYQKIVLLSVKNKPKFIKFFMARNIFSITYLNLLYNRG